MELFVASDIFGRTPELENIVSRLEGNYSKVTLLDPYAGKYRDFECEKEAYSYFMQNVGLQKYIKIVFEAIKQNQVASHMLGFSIGASSFWAISQKNIFHEQARMFCFYGSQIRKFSEINPAVETTVFFPKAELHFNVPGLISEISKKTNVRCVQTVYLHGFMNKKSNNYSKTGFSEYIEILRNTT